MCVQWMKVKADLACRFLLPLLSLVALMPTVQCQEAASSAVDAAKPAVEVAPLVLPDAELSFERHVRPLLKTWCLDCHGGE